MSARFLEIHSHWPTARKQFDDFLSRLAGVGGQQGARLKTAPGIAHQHPADRHRGFARVIPEGSARGHLDSPSALTVPVDPEPLPAGPRDLESGRQRGQAPALERGAALSAGLVRGGGCKQRGIQAQGHNQGDAQSLGSGQQVQHGVATIGHKDQGSLRHPAPELPEDLPGSIRQVLRLASPALRITGRGLTTERG